MVIGIYLGCVTTFLSFLVLSSFSLSLYFLNTMNKYKYGEVFTPKVLVTEMWQLFKERIYNKNVYQLSPLSIFEPGAGHGVFYDIF